MFDFSLPLNRPVLPQDWEYQLASDYHWQVESRRLGAALHLDPLLGAPAHTAEPSAPPRLDAAAPLFGHTPAVFFVLHLVYEDLKLDELMRKGAHQLVVLLQQLAR